MKHIMETPLEKLMRKNFIEYASYSILDRAIPDLRDGLKPVQRRILHTLFEINDGRFHKVAGVIGETMKLHPHGDASIADALVVLANKDYFIDRQGNFGSVLTGHPAAARPAPEKMGIPWMGASGRPKPHLRGSIIRTA